MKQAYLLYFQDYIAGHWTLKHFIYLKTRLL